MEIADFIWLPEVEEKLDWKHAVQTWEVEEVFVNDPLIRFIQKGRRPGEDVYAAFGQSDAGRYLVVYYIYKLDKRALIMSARDMERTERRQYERR